MRITDQLLRWYDQEKRVFAFRDTHDPYYIWVSEIMLQQTRTETVERYFTRFIEAFPTVEALAAAQEEQVLKMWEGLGYYSRARNLLKAARMAAKEGMPLTFDALQKLPGIGGYTAAAIASIAYGEKVPAMDGNLTRVIARLYQVEENAARPSVKRKLFDLGRGLLDTSRPGDMNQAMMDLGATVCLSGTPDCGRCPIARHCKAEKTGDPSYLPILPDKKPQRPIDMTVALVKCRDRLLLFRRKEKLLNGLYVFYLTEGDGGEALEALKALGIRAQLKSALGEARHVFTHLIWNMQGILAEAENAPDIPDALWATAEEIAALPLPTAMKKPRQWAMEVLK